MARIARFCIVLLTAAGSVSTAHASPVASVVCGTRTTVVAHLEHTYREHQETIHLQSEESLLELFVSPAGTWSILRTTPTGYSCVVATGKGLPQTARL